MSAFASLPVGAVTVHSGICGDNLIWTLDDEGTLTISGTGDMYDYSGENASPWKEFSGNIVSVVLGDGVTSIGICAFIDCASLVDVAISDNVDEIGSGAFYGCSSLEEISIPDGVESIFEYTFYNCSSLTDVVIPDSVKYISGRAFNGCDSIRYSTYDNGLYLGNNENPYYALIRMADQSAATCIVSEGTKILAEYAFGGCISLTSVVIPGGIEEIVYVTFSKCPALEEIVLSEGVKRIGADAFVNCSSVHSFTFPATLESFDLGSLIDCGSITDVYYNGSYKQWMNIEFSNSKHINDRFSRAEFHYALSNALYLDGDLFGNYSEGETVRLSVPASKSEGGVTMRFYTWQGADVDRSSFFEREAETGNGNGRYYFVTMPDSELDLTPIFIMVGDVTDDGKINTRDLSRMKALIADVFSPTDITLEAADINLDGRVNTRDISCLKRMIADSYVPEK